FALLITIHNVTVTLLANSLRSYRQASKGGTFCLCQGNLVQPAYQSDHVQRRGGAEVLQMRFRRTDVTTPTHPTRTHTLRDRPLAPGTCSVLLGEERALLSLPRAL